MKKKIIIILSLFIFISLSLSSNCYSTPKESNASGVFYKANALFKEGKYEQAKDEYASILNLGIESGNLYYNLGNAYFKLGKLGKAILNYERAKLFIPQDSDSKSNLDFARSLLESPLIFKKQNFVTRFLEKLSDYFSLDGLSVIVSGLYFILFFSIAVSMLHRKGPAFFKYLINIGFILLFIFGCVWGVKFYRTQIQQYAIIITSFADCRFAPAEDAVTHFRVYEGAKVNILNKDGNWRRIKTPDAKIGWIKDTALERIVSLKNI